jgi:DeoR/GlpR family transcriptional regulator of sugar metabolism
MSSTSEKRREDIISLIHSNGKVKVTELSEKYNVSEVSIRKDLEALEALGHLSRIHGGAVGMNNLYLNMTLTERYKTNSSSKKEAAELAARFINDNDTIMMNAGTTLAYVLHALRGKKNISIVTNSVQNAMEAALYPSFRIILLGGEIDSKYQFTYGQDAVDQLQNYHATKCILSIDGISAESGLTTYYSNGAEVARKMVESSDYTIVVADSSKIGKKVFSRVTHASDVDLFVTNKSDNHDELLKLRKLGVEIQEA